MASTKSGTEHVRPMDFESPKRSFGPLNIIAAAFNICQAWAAVGATFVLGIAHGGSVGVVYGLLIILVFYGAIVLSLAELAARYPTTGGQYHWTALIAPKPVKRQLSYICGAMNTIGWITLTASIMIVPPQIMVGIVRFFNTAYVIQRWHVFLIYQGLLVLSLLYNIFALQPMPWAHDIGFVLSVTSFLVITIACLAIASPKESTGFVWTEFQNETGWTSPGIAFMTGLININYGFAGLDGAIHLADECLNAATVVPWALVSAFLANFGTAAMFMIAMLYCIRDFDSVLNTPTGFPLYEVWHQAIKSSAAATIFIVLLIIVLSFTCLAAQQTSSRLIWSFARDDALLFSNRLKRLHPRLNVPVWALLYSWFWAFILGCIYLGSSTAFNAIVAPGLILEQISFAIPSALLIWQHREQRFLPSSGWCKLGRWGWIVNFTSVIWALVELVFYSLPPQLPVNGDNMNYTCAVLGGVAILITLNWIFFAKQNFHGPTKNVLEALE